MNQGQKTENQINKVKKSITSKLFK